MPPWAGLAQKPGDLIFINRALRRAEKLASLRKATVLLLAQSSPDGCRYHVHRVSDDFKGAMPALWRDVKAHGLPSTIGCAYGQDECLMMVGPLQGEMDCAFRLRWIAFIVDQ